MAANEPNDRQTDAEVPLPPSDADVEPPEDDVLALGDELKTTVDVSVPAEIVTAVAYRAGARSARNGTVTPEEIRALTHDYVQVAARFLVERTDMPLEKWIDERAGVPVDHSDPVAYPDDRASTPARVPIKDPVEAVLAARQVLETVDASGLGDGAEGRLTNALEHLDNIVLGAADDGRMPTAGADEEA